MHAPPLAGCRPVAVVAGGAILLLVSCRTQDPPRRAAEAPTITRGRVAVPGGELAYAVHGSGEPILFIHGSHVADSFEPLAEEPALAGYQRILYDRRGLGGSTPHHGPFSIADQAADARAVLQHLGLARVHVIGHSYGAVTALQLAHDYPDVVRTLTLLEPPLLMVPSGAASGAELGPAVEAFAAGNDTAAVELFMERIVGPGWQSALERALPGGTAQALQDPATFFEVELPALAAWEFGPEQARGVRAPVLYMRGSESGPLFEEGLDLVGAWYPGSERLVIPGGSHMFPLQAAEVVAAAFTAFLDRHPEPPGTD